MSGNHDLRNLEEMAITDGVLHGCKNMKLMRPFFKKYFVVNFIYGMFIVKVTISRWEKNSCKMMILSWKTHGK